MADNMSIKDKVGLYITIFGFVGAVAGYGISIGRLSQRVDSLETRQNKVESIVDNKLDELQKSVNELSKQTAVLSDRVESLKSEMKGR